MEAKDALGIRRSIRHFDTGRLVEREKTRKVLEGRGGAHRSVEVVRG